MRQIEEPSRVTPVMAETDVLVVGSGPGGLSAALSAAREGGDTILLEWYGCLVEILPRLWLNLSPGIVMKKWWMLEKSGSSWLQRRRCQKINRVRKGASRKHSKLGQGDGGKGK